MIQQQYPSQLLEKAVTEFSKLPGIGRKTALRLVLWMLRQDSEDVEQFAAAVSQLKREVKYCHTCHNISDTESTVTLAIISVIQIRVPSVLIRAEMLRPSVS